MSIIYSFNFQPENSFHFGGKSMTVLPTVEFTFSSFSWVLFEKKKKLTLTDHHVVIVWLNQRKMFQLCKLRPFHRHLRSVTSQPWMLLGGKSRNYAKESLRANIEEVKAGVSRKLAGGPGLKEFLIVGKNLPKPDAIVAGETIPYLMESDFSGNGRKVFFEVYGCQMNVNDTEIVWAILKENGFAQVHDVREADIVLVMTCSIREGAESKVRLSICP